ncbi:hypothetical protein GJAV_G00050750 [Gymnothorax javanicus]|nr:hypothetical protein GJAV_G00050750 [Gymnothorax javanicus]
MLVPAEALLHCLGRPRPSALSIAAATMRNCSTHRLQFELWCLEPSNMEQLAERLDEFLPLLEAYLTTASGDDPARPKDVQTAVLRALRDAVLPPLCCSVLSGGTDDSLSPRVDVLSHLISLVARAKDLRELAEGLPALLRTEEGSERWKLVEPITAKLAGSPEQLACWSKSLPAAALRWLISAYSSWKEQEKAAQLQEESMLQRARELLVCPEDVPTPDWNSFVKTGLKYRYRDRAFLETLCSLLEVMYSGNVTPKDLLPLATIHMMTTSHSLFLPSMLSSQEEANDLSLSKEALVSLLLTLVKMCPAVCDSSHFVLLLGAYGATLSSLGDELCHQKLLLILQEYERNNVSLAEFKSLLWGPAAVEHHKACRSLGKSLWQQPSSEDLLALLSSERMLNTVRLFPQQRRIIPQEAKELLYREERVKDLGSLYDPCFLLPLFSSLLRPECVVDCYKFVSSHALGVTVAALSSYDPKVRAAAYQVLGSFYHHLEGARFREKRQLLYLLDAVKNGIRQQNLRLPFLLVTYIAKVAQQMLRPEEHMYMIVNKFLLTHQYLDLKKVPEFFQLFYSFDLEHRVEREWVLEVLQEGLVDRYCYQLCDRQGIFQILLSFQSSPLCDESTQCRIMEVLQRVSGVNTAAYELIKVHGLLTWILQAAEWRRLESRALSAVIDLVQGLWFTNLGQKESGGGSNAPSGGDPPQGPAKCLPLPLVNEFLCVLIAIIGHLQSGVKAPQLAPFLRTLVSVLQHRKSAMAAHGELGRLTVPVRSLSCTESLALLQHWSLLSHDAPLQSALRGVAERHKVKELLGGVKERGRAKGPSQRSRTRAELCSEETERGAEQLDQAALEECEPHLRTILTHWDPHLPPPDSVPTDHPDLTASTAHLLVKWTLRSLVSGTQERAGRLCFLRWVQEKVLPHRGAVDALLADPSVMQDLLRLYHQACEAGRPLGSPAEAETVQLFTAVMLALLEVRGGLTEGLHQAVLQACLSQSQEDESRRGAGQLLLSVYIHELWSGAESPDLFLTHVRLVTGARGQGPKRSKGQTGKLQRSTDRMPKNKLKRTEPKRLLNSFTGSKQKKMDTFIPVFLCVKACIPPSKDSEKLEKSKAKTKDLYWMPVIFRPSDATTSLTGMILTSRPVQTPADTAELQRLYQQQQETGEPRGSGEPMQCCPLLKKEGVSGRIGQLAQDNNDPRSDINLIDANLCNQLQLQPQKLPTPFQAFGLCGQPLGQAPAKQDEGGSSEPPVTPDLSKVPNPTTAPSISNLAQRPLRGGLYSLSRPEQEAMEKYVEESLAAGIIHPSSSPAGAGFFFGATIFTKLDLRNAYHLTQPSRA